MKVSIFGLGYVGAVSSGCLAADGHEVIGVDLNEDKVALINAGKTPIIEDDIGEIIATAVKNKRLRAVSDTEEAVFGSELSIVSVGTPSRENGSLDLNAVERVCENIGAAIKKKDAYHRVVMRSTVLPGTVRNVMIPALERASGKKHNEGFSVCFNPEFLREGSSVRDHYDPPYTLMGADRQEDGEVAASLYEKVKGERYYSSIETAEMVKYVCNAFHALKLTFANEMGILGQSMGVDSMQVMDLVCKDTKLNISPRYMRPGFAFGGSCLPKDVRALISQARHQDLDLPLVRSLIGSNRSQIDRAIKMILGKKKKKVSILGLSFKAGTDDLRESPLVNVTEALLGKGLAVKIYDKSVSVARLVGANKAYIEKEIPHISSLMTSSLQEAVDHGEILVIGNGAPEFSNLAELCKPGQTIVDLVHIAGLSDVAGVDYQGIVW
jgi:GDP-mannose 6-dehydrogenase